MSGAARFITLEGIEGVGKSTQAALLSQCLQALGIAHGVTREPGGTPLAESIRRLVLTAGGEPLPPTAELLLMFAARSVHLTNRVKPDLRAGRWVICDRFTDATYAYQGGGRGLRTDHIAQLETLVQGALQPDLTVLLDAPVTTALARARARSAAPADRFEQEECDFFERVRDAYRARAAKYPERIVMLDAVQAPEVVSAHLLALLQERSWIP